MPPGAWVQGDDFAGGNPPFPSYIDTAAFDSWYTGSGTYRRAYDSAYASAGVDHIIDTAVKFNGHNTLRMDFGAGHSGAGWDSLFSDDGDPVETNGPFFGGYQGVWTRTIWKADANVTEGSDNTLFGQGLEVLCLNIGAGVFQSISFQNRNSKIIMDVRLGTHGGNQAPVDLCNENVFVGRASGFGELITLFERTNVGDETFKIRAWAGDACSLVGVSPLINQDYAPSTPSGTNGCYETRHFNPTWTKAGAIKHLWLAAWRQEPSLVAEGGSLNPYGVALT